MQNTQPCPFCSIDANRIIHQNTHGFAVRDGFPVSQGHSLIIPKRHVGSFFDLSREEHIALLDLLDLCHAELTSSVIPSVVEGSRLSVIPNPEPSTLSSRESAVEEPRLSVIPSAVEGPRYSVIPSPVEGPRYSVIPDPDPESSVSSRHPEPSSCHPERMRGISPLTLSSRPSEIPSLSSRPSAASGEISPSAFNIGINDGPAAGQTVPHCHIHLSPRDHGDVKDPRGGVRWVLPEKADYWSHL